MIPVNEITNLCLAIDDWLRPDNSELKLAIDRTVEEGFFSFEDIKHQIQVLKKTLNEESIREWADRNRSSDSDGGQKRILFLHAGNLPLVGVQDVIAATLCNVSYGGKISRKDPYLLPTLLTVLRKHGFLKNSVWSTEIDDFKNFRAEAMVFSGSGSNAEVVRNKVLHMNALKAGAPELIRSAHFSIAFIDETSSSTMQQLTEAVFRYGGMGCRSVKIVISPVQLNNIRCEFTDYIESFWLKNPQYKKPPASLFHRFACNKAVGIEQSWLDDFLIEETEKRPEHDFVLHWVEGGLKKLHEITARFSGGLQSVYLCTPETEAERLSAEIELLKNAQSPPVCWQPDGIDTIAWILSLSNLD
ncbi:MAG TPA: hypothetical protein VKM36_00875 [Balneolaceae bacterium]|nr:hypothetical protein [Balneolaceae bacterium]